MENFKIDDLGKYTSLSGIKHSPDGTHACFILHESSIEENKYLSDLWILDIKTNEYHKLTSTNTVREFFWLDNKTIVFPDIRNDKDKEKKKSGYEFTQYYKIDIYGGEACKFFRINKDVSEIRYLDEDTYLFTAEHNINQNELYLLDDDAAEVELKERKEEKDYEVIDEIPFWINGGTFTSKKRSRLYIYKKAQNSIEPVTEELTNVGLFEVNEEKSKVLILGNTFKNKMELCDDLAVWDIKSKKLTKFPQKDAMIFYYGNFITNNEIVFLGTDMKKLGVNQNQTFYYINLSSGASKCLTPDLDVSVENSVGSDCRHGASDEIQVYNNSLYFVTTEDDSSYLNKLDLNGNITKLSFDKGSVDGISINNTILTISMKPSSLEEIYQLTDGACKKITSFNDWVLAERKISVPEELVIETAPNVQIKGWVIKPQDYNESKKYPAILDIHGGPKTVYGTVFINEMQYWASEGYFVFFCNPRGSDGKGDDFSDIRGKYGTIDYEDIMKFTDAVLQKYSAIDSERIGVTGGSYGGFMTNWIIGHTQRFKAAASQRSISNWFSKFGITDIGYYFVPDQNLSTPWNNPEKLWSHSPLKYADKAVTPTLFLHSEEDYRCYIAEGFQMFTALKFHGVDSRFIMFRGENHELSRSGKPKHKIRRLKEITEWFDKYLK